MGGQWETRTPPSYQTKKKTQLFCRNNNDSTRSFLYSYTTVRFPLDAYPTPLAFWIFIHTHCVDILISLRPQYKLERVEGIKAGYCMKSDCALKQVGQIIQRFWEIAESWALINSSARGNNCILISPFTLERVLWVLKHHEHAFTF